MKHITHIATIMVFTACGIFGQSLVAVRATDLREIERVEDEWSVMNEISDAVGKRRLLADDSYHVGPSGRFYTKQQDIEAAELSYRQKQASTASVKFFVEDRKIRLYKNVAVVTATGWSVTTNDGKERRGRSFRVVHVWEKHRGRWQLVVDQVTGVAN